jgi:hypothetical protein
LNKEVRLERIQREKVDSVRISSPNLILNPEVLNHVQKLCKKSLSVRYRYRPPVKFIEKSRIVSVARLMQKVPDNLFIGQRAEVSLSKEDYLLRTVIVPPVSFSDLYLKTLRENAGDVLGFD